VAYKHVHDRPEPPSTFEPSIPAETEAVVMRALAKDPDARFPSAEAFRQAITAAAGGEPTEPLGGDTAVLPATTEPLGPPPGSRRSLVPVAVLAAILLVVGIMALALSGANERDRDGRLRQAERSPTPEEQPTAADVLGVAEATIAFQEIVASLLEADLLSEEVAREALEDQQDATNAYAAGDLDSALKHLDDADADIESSLGEGAIASSDVAASLHEGIHALREAMLAAPPPSVIEESPAEEEDGDEEEGGDSGPGNSENAPGHQKKEEEDD
jgi:hypothetical protein